MRRCIINTMQIRIHHKNLLKYFPKSLLRLIRDDGDLDIMPGEHVRIEACVLFADIRNFTAISESLSSDEVFDLMNEFINQIMPAVSENGGILDKIVGDAFLAIFPDSAADAVNCAIDLAGRLEKFNNSVRDKEYYPLKIGIGIHKGSCTVGVIGNENFNQITILGDAVNLSSRIEAVTKTYQTQILVSDSVYRGMDNPNGLYWREVDSVRVKGKDHPVVLYEVSDPGSESSIKERVISEDYVNALILYKAGIFSESKILFEKCLAVFPDDAVLQIYIKRCATFMRLPPGKDWSGITGIL